MHINLIIVLDHENISQFIIIINRKQAIAFIQVLLRYAGNLQLFKNEQTAFFTAGFSLPTAASITPSVFQMEQLHSMISPISLIVLCKIWLDNNPFTSPFFSIYDKWENCEIPPSSSDNTI